MLDAWGFREYRDTRKTPAGLMRLFEELCSAPRHSERNTWVGGGRGSAVGRSLHTDVQLEAQLKSGNWKES